MKDYLIFVDETKPSTYQPYFCFAGIVIERTHYETVLIQEINNLKNHYFNTSNIIFHFSDMKKNRNKFSILQDEKTRNNFWNDYISLIKNTSFDILGIYFNDAKMTHLQHGKQKNNYNIGFYLLLDSFMHYLIDNDGYGQICVESRSFNENKYLLDTFYQYQQNGSIYFENEDIKKHLASIGFNIKQDNCIGLQVVDLIPSQLIRYKVGCKKDFYNLCKTLSTKIYNVGTDYENIIGIKNILE